MGKVTSLSKTKNNLSQFPVGVTDAKFRCCQFDTNKHEIKNKG